LFRWAWNSAVGTKHTTIPFLGFKASAAVGALVEKLAGIGGHRFFLLKTALGAFDDRF